MKVLIASLVASGLLLCAGACQQPVSSTVGGHGYPSIFQAWSGIENIADADDVTLMAKHNLVFSGPWCLRLLWSANPQQPWTGLSTNLVDVEQAAGAELKLDPACITARARRTALRKLNPNLKLLCELRYREGYFTYPGGLSGISAQDAFPPDSPFWLRDENGELCPGWGEDANHDGKVDRDEVQFMLIDFRKKDFQELLARKALAVKQSGLFDGIMLDWWNEEDATTGRWPDWKGTYLTGEEEREARLAILRAIRQAVGDDFLILVNANDRTVPRSAPYVNGLFMESWKKQYDRGYTLAQIKQIETTLLWAENNLKTPQINCLEGWREVTAYAGDQIARVQERNSPRNRQWMRMFTALSLTHSDGYVCFVDDNAMPSPDHLHNWYDFWSPDLGQPVSDKAQVYNATVGLFVREFNHGWAVYNRSGKPQPVRMGAPTRAVSTGIISLEQVVPDLDGDILLKSTAAPESGHDPGSTH